MSEVYNRREPMAYVYPKYKQAKEWFESVAPQLREQWDMYMANDAYMREREAAGYAHLSYPMIHVAIEAILAAVHKVLQSEQNIHVYEAIDPHDVFSKIAAEHLTSAFSHIRADTQYDERVLDLVLSSSIFDFVHMMSDIKHIPVTPQLGLMVQEEDMVLDKPYPSWEVYAPGRVLFDGNYESDEQIPCRFKESFLTYQELKRDWPKQVGKWMLKHERPFNELEYSARSSMSNAGDDTIYYFYRNRMGMKEPQDARRGYLLVQAFVAAVDGRGDVENRVIWWLPQVVPDGDATGIHTHGYVLGSDRPAFDSIPQPFRTCRSRRLPFSVLGRGTSSLLISHQRQFSAQVSQEMDMDQMYQGPPVLMREGAWIGREDPAFNAREIWTVGDPTDSGLRLDQLVQPMQLQTPNRGYLQIMDEKLRNMADLISGAVEATTGGESSDPNKTATAFQGRMSGAMNRIMVQFVEHALSLIWQNQQALKMMNEAPGEFLYPPVRTFSESIGAPGILTPQLLKSAVKVRVPALSEHALKEFQKVLWGMVGDRFATIPIYAQSPELQLWYIERMVRAMGVAESDVQEAMMAARQGVMGAMQAATAGGMPVNLGGAPPPGVTPGKAVDAGNMRPALAAA